MKRICLFAAYDPEGMIDDHVIHYLKELSEYADIHYLADCEMDPGELKKIAPYTASASAYRHGKYDFGSWSELIKKIEWDEIEKYDELILANDSQYLVGDIGQFLTSMENRAVDFWAGLTVCEEYVEGRIPLDQFISSRNILETSFTFVSSFLVLSKELFSQAFIQNFFNEITAVRDRLQVYSAYEIGLTRLIIRHHVNYGVFIEDLYSQSSIYKNSAFFFLTLGYPFIKVKVFFDQYYPIIAPMKRFDFIQYYNPKLNTDILIQHLKRVEPYHFQKNDTAKFSFDKIFRSLSKFIYEISPKFMAQFYKRMIDKFDVYMFETQFFKSKLYYFSKFLTTIPEQRKLAKILKDKKKLIIYFNDSRDIISGGMLSINRFVRKSKQALFLSSYEVLLSGLPLYNPPVKYSYFDEAGPQIKFSNIVKNCHPEELIIHLPEVFAFTFFENLSDKEKEFLVKIPKLQINILNQNNEMMPERSVIRNILGELTENITITTAHSTYCTQQLSNQYSAPVHQLTPFLPEFLKVDFEDKEKRILISNDDSLYGSTKITKKDILTKLQGDLPDYEIIEIQKIPLEEYKKLIAHSLFTISFGEGFDGYFIEPILSKSLSFAVYNPYYFPSEFSNSDIVYSSWDELFNNIVEDIKMFSEDKAAYERASSANFVQISKYFSQARSMRKLKKFYDEDYDFVPKKVEYKLFHDVKAKLHHEYGFEFLGGSQSEDFVLAPDGNIFHNMRGDFYNVLYDVYIQKPYAFNFDREFILIDLGFHAGIAAMYLLNEHKNLERVYGFEPMLPTYHIGLENIKNSQFGEKVVLKPLALSDHFDLKKLPYIPDWASQISIEPKNNFYDMYSSSEMKNEILYVTTEIVPAHTELRKIIDNSPFKVVLKCDVQGSESKLIKNLDEHELLKKIDLLITKTYKEDPQPIIDRLQKNGFLVEDIMTNKVQNIHKISATKKD